MMLSWCFKARRVHFPRLACLLILLSTLASPAWGHPDLLLQIEELDLALVSSPTDADLLARRGDLYRRHEDFAAAALDLAAARAAQPDYPPLDLYEGMLLLDTGSPAGADTLLSRYLRDHTQQASAWILRAQARLAMGQAEQAAQDYAQAIRYADQSSPGLYRDWSLALVAAGTEHWNAARDVADTGLERFPRDVALLALGTDIALAINLPDIAAAYINRLPPTITRLDQWQARRVLSGCLGEENTASGKQECQGTAIRLLQEQAALPDM
jgi:tetratricopeptide (TPR) repeat protein